MHIDPKLEVPIEKFIMPQCQGRIANRLARRYDRGRSLALKRICFGKSGLTVEAALQEARNYRTRRSSKPSGLFDCHRQELAHIVSTPVWRSS